MLSRTMNPADASARRDWRPFPLAWALGAALLIGWRAYTQPLPFLFRDWIVALAIYGLVGTFDWRHETRGRISMYFMVYLLGIYALGQAPHLWKAIAGVP
jgi:hypothetical protein